jgi:hypothetical protein
MTQEQAVQSKPETQKRERQFGRTYDHDAGTAKFTSAFEKDFSLEVNLSKVPEAVLRSFALQAIADYCANEANAAYKEDGPVAALEAIQGALTEVYEGQLDFRSGTGLGGNRSAINALGAVLWELGKTKVKDQFGHEYPITDLNTAKNAARTLYLSVIPREWEVDGKKHSLTGRQIFNAICEVPEIKSALAAKRKAKPAVDVSTMLE